jgi:hypothetical protein
LKYANSGEKTRVALRINCNNEISEDGKLKIISDILDNFAYPELARQIRDNEISPDSKLENVHLVMYSDQKRNEILFNQKVRFLVNPKYKDNKQVRSGQIVELTDIDEIMGIYPDSTNDPNAGHIMLTKFKEDWYFACDLIYNINISKKICENSNFYISNARKHMQEHRWTLFIDNLLFACMLLVQSIFILQFNTAFTLKQTHAKYLDLLLSHTKNGNIDSMYANHYTELFEQRKKMKHSQNSINTIHINKKVARKFMNMTRNFFNYTYKFVNDLASSRTPQVNYIQFQFSPRNENSDGMILNS